MPARKPTLPALSFDHLLAYAEIESFAKKLAAARPDLVRLGSIGKSREGREVFALTITDFATGAPEDKPAYLIHGNIHAPELSGTHASLFTARQLVGDYPKTTKLLADVAFHIIPRLNPDGAEFAVQTCGYIRSRHDHANLPPNTIIHKDMDGNGRILTMRLEHPDGDKALDPRDKRLLVRRKADSKPPFYKTWPEGEIINWDGSPNIAIEGRQVDWNRQWGFDWRPEPDQSGSGDFPYSEPEMRAIAEFITARPNLFGALGYHTGPAALLRPPSAGSDSDLPEADVRKMEELGRVSKKLTGLECVAVVRYGRKSSRGLNLYGHFPMTGYKHLGLFVFEYELGTMWTSAGVDFKAYQEMEDEAEIEGVWRRMVQWCDRHPQKRPVFHPWRKFRHPQLGPVELGGLSLRDWANMTLADLRKRCGGTYKFTLHHAAQHPSVRLEDVEVTPLGGGVRRIRARVANRGGLPTHVTERGKTLKRLAGVRVEFQPGKGVELLSYQGHRTVGHLAAATGSQTLEWFVRAPRGATCLLLVRGGTGGNVTEAVRL